MKKILLLWFIPFMLFANIKEIKYEGLIHLSKVSANNISLLKQGDTFDEKKVNQTIKAFYNYGYFETINAYYKNNILTFKFKEKPVVRKITYKNISNDLKKLLKKRFSLKKGEIYQKKTFENVKDFIIQYYIAKGVYENSVFITTKRVKSFIDVQILLQKGKKVYIRKINFIGNKSFSKSKLEDEMQNQEENGLGFLPFVNDGSLNIFKLMKDKNSIRDYYLSKGFLDVKIETPYVVANFNRFTSNIDIKITEGKRYKVGNIGITIDKKNIINIKDELTKLKLKKGRYFNVKLLRKDIERLRIAVADKGYAFAKVYPNIKKKGNIASIDYQIISGNKFYISNVVIKGNNKTLDRVIRRSIYLTPGSLYSYTNKIDSINALKRTGYFESVKMKEIKVDDSHMKILVIVSEGMTGALKAGISYSSYEKFGIEASVSERNIFGSGQDLSLSLSKSSKSSSYSLSLKNPRVFDSIYSLTTSIYNKTFESTDYTSHRKGFSVGVGRSIGRFISTGATYQYENVELTKYDNNDSSIKPNTIKSAITPYISYDNTDNYFFPTSGMKLYSSFEFAGIGGDQKYLKNIESAKFFNPINDANDDLEFVAKYRVKIGAIKDLGYLPIDDRFYLGGLGSIRGFKTGSISPRDANGNLIGGNIMFEQSAELSVPMSIKNKLWASLFVDQGGTGDSKLNMIKSSYGLSIDWITPVGPLSFVYALPIQSNNQDDLSQFEFNIGMGF